MDSVKQLVNWCRTEVLRTHVQSDKFQHGTTILSVRKGKEVVRVV